MRRIYLLTVFMILIILVCPLSTQISFAEGGKNIDSYSTPLNVLLPANLVGEAIDAPTRNSSGQFVQLTSKGLLLWGGEASYFTDGEHTWVLGPYGLQERGAENRFGWEISHSPRNVTLGSDFTAQAEVKVLGDLAEYAPDNSLVSLAGMTPQDAAEILYPVTKNSSLSPSYKPQDLVVSNQFGVPGGVLIRGIIGPDLAEMQKASGGRLVALSGYRSYKYQESLFNNYLRAELSVGDGYDAALARTNRYSALPGHSQHQLGTAIDFNSLEDDFANTDLGKWLMENSWRFGFVMSYPPNAEAVTGYMYEPWHYRWVGRALARSMWDGDYLVDPNATPDRYYAAAYGVLGSQSRGALFVKIEH